MKSNAAARLSDPTAADAAGPAPGRRPLLRADRGADPAGRLLQTVHGARARLRGVCDQHVAQLHAARDRGATAVATAASVAVEASLRAVRRDLDDARVLAVAGGHAAVLDTIEAVAAEVDEVEQGAAAPDAPAATTGGLPPALRAEMEHAFAADFSGVTVGEDAEAARRGALAFTRGEHIAFAPGRLAPDTPAGKALLGHELMHVLHQRGGHAAAPRGGGDVVDDAALEREADDAGDRVARGEPVGATAAGGRATGDVVQYKRSNVFVTNNDSGVDAKTGVLDHQVALVEDFAAKVTRCLERWGAQRGTANLRFERGEEMRVLYRDLRNKLARDPAGPVAFDGARRLIDTPRNRQFIQEIRMFASDLLGDYKQLLGLEDNDVTHHYEMCVGMENSDVVTLGGGRAGVLLREIALRYTCPQLGLSWIQRANIKGFILGAQVSAGAVKNAKQSGGGGDPTDGDKVSPRATATVKDGGGWSEPEHQPVRYLPPTWLAGADYTRGTVAAKGQLWIEEAALTAGDVAISNLVGAARMTLTWRMPPGLSYATKLPVPLKKGDVKKGLYPDKPGVDASVVGQIEDGTATLAGDTEVTTTGTWNDEEHDAPAKLEWAALHAAQIYFETGDAELGAEDHATLNQVTAAIQARIHEHGTERFKIEVIGCHSRGWKGLDDRMVALMRRFADGEISQAKFDRGMEKLEAEKTGGNQGLAQLRAENVHLALAARLPHITAAWALDPHRQMAEPTTRAPIGDDPTEDLGEDRSVYVIVRYAL